MKLKPRLFWDSSALIDAIFAPNSSPYRELLALGQEDRIDMRISPDVLRESEAVIRQYGEDLLGELAIVLHRANIATTALPSQETVDYCEQLTGYRSDAKILAAAEECLADILVTHDKQHFLGNPLISPPETHCRVKTAQETLQWCLQKLLADEEER